jgi:hypothetical protein
MFFRAVLLKMPHLCVISPCQLVQADASKLFSQGARFESSPGALNIVTEFFFMVFLGFLQAGTRPESTLIRVLLFACTPPTMHDSLLFYPDAV